MTITDRNAPPPAKKVWQIPTWAAVTALAMCFVVAVGIIWYIVWGSGPKKKVIQVDPNLTAPTGQAAIAAARGRAAPRRPPPPQTGLTLIRDGEWLVRTNGAGMRVSRKDSGDFTIVPFYTTALSLSTDQVALMAGRYRILHDDAMAQEWQITPDQIEKIKKIQTDGIMRVLPSDQTQLKSAWTDYVKAGDGQPKADAEKKLVAAVDDVGKRSLEPTKSAMDQKLNEFQAILTPDQVAKLTKK